MRHSSAMRRFLLRVALFILPGVALWALLPLVASERLEMGPGGYGLLLAALGLGAVGGAFLMPRVQARLSDNHLLAIASMVYAGALAVVALVPNATVVTLALIPAGTAWMAVLANVNAIVQMFLPRWVRARGLGAYQVVFFGGQALGALAWGLIAERIGLVNTFLAAAVLTALCTATLARWPLIETRHLDREPAVFWPEPNLTVDARPGSGAGRRHRHLHRGAGGRAGVPGRNAQCAAHPDAYRRRPVGHLPARRDRSTGCRRSMSCRPGASTCASTPAGSPAPTGTSSYGHRRWPRDRPRSPTCCPLMPATVRNPEQIPGCGTS